MGWLSWERFRCNVDCDKDPDNCISEKLIKSMADLMVSEGFKDAGYEYVCSDDCWQSMTRGPDGRLQADPKRFPSGIKALADYVHGKGLKLGIYEDFGYLTCEGFPGSEFYLQLDAQTFADWEVDLVKFDGCHSQLTDFDYGYPAMSFYLNKTGRPMVYMCEWPDYLNMNGIMPNYTAIRKSCNYWRNYDDVQDSWDSVLDIINHFGNNSGNFSSFAGPGGWNDPDQLVVGDFGLSPDQERVQMAMWAMMASPLLMSVDLRNIRQESKGLLQNKYLIEINQDPRGIMGTRRYTKGSIEIWTRPLTPPGQMATAFLNTGYHGVPRKLTVTGVELGLQNYVKYNIYDAFNRNKIYDSVIVSDNFTVIINPTGIVMFRIENV
ncbi:hypothetical protein LOTGIDRAFT_178842 [Lottia gigantea]|uniref:Alpha-galactosidase n=1 Tax=Lottia gigantea TaxID=225164 RepID=V4A1Y8_LOTGI|nr:hypothetical protein LOTGIDRAFT_178842 [Lottia gigantea]ESO90697.1 hypothetical protein LOTGIDRAFT_178842 [Lottia gigantea]